MLIETENTYIGTLRATGSWHDPLALRVRLERMISVTDLRPPSLPKHAIVCIRKFRDPLPVRWRTQDRDVRPPLEWERTIATALDQLVRRAAHPGRDTAPGNADAVVFADYAELLACLASDWCDGDAPIHWWWQSILRGQDVAGAVLRAWRESPEFIPAALQLLARSGRAVSFAHALLTAEAGALVQSLTRRFALPQLRGALEVRDQPRHEGAGAVTLPNRSPQLASPSASHMTLPGPPWQPWVPESIGHGLDFEHQCFLGIGLMLWRGPTIMRLPSFASAVQSWARVAGLLEGDKALEMTAGWMIMKDATRRATDVEPAVSEMDQAGVGPKDTSGRPWERGFIPSPLVKEGQDGGEPWRDVGPVDSHQPHSLPWRDVASVDSPQPNLLPSSENEQAAADAASVPIPLAIDRVVQLPPAALSASEPAYGEAIAAMPELSSSSWAVALDRPDLQIETGLGGLFYLINVGLCLNLYGDFTTPAQPWIALPVWDFVTLLGQKLMGVTMHDDPVWGLLARLSDRSEQAAPGADFDPPSIWRLPVEWLRPFPEDGVWRWQAIDGRLQVRHPAQFLVLDVPFQPADPALQLRDALQDYGTEIAVEPLLRSVSVDTCATAPLDRWLGWLMPYVRARLQRALQLPNADELTQILCTHHARVFVTATHVDILMALDALPIGIRLAGLDRDPGWVPAAGRFIAFHFE